MVKLPSRYVPKGVPVAGGFGQTLLCRDQELDRDVVIKEISDPTQVQRIIDEVVALHSARSKHVVEIFDVVLSTDGTNIAIVEEYLPGDDLTNFTFSEKGPAAFLRIAYQVARGLMDIHSRNIVHRDIKPNNMKFDAEGYLKIFDFGLAKTAPLPGTTGTLTGTPGYMAPELFTYPPVIDKPVDVYAFGATMFCLVTGHVPPCARPWPQPPAALVASESISDLGFANVRLSPLIDACLHLDRDDRPQMAHMVQALEREILFGKHRARLTSAEGVTELGTVGKRVRARHPRHGSGSIEIGYDGFDFKVVALEGSVFINNKPAVLGAILDGAHVLTLGATGRRLFVTFDVSHPEVVL